ncbi:MAG: DUF2062 domain-containing protein [Pelovirga sp.]
MIPVSRHYFITIPVYNHAATLREVVEKCLRYQQPVLVVDDGSSTPVADLLTGLPVELVSHERNQGKGAALLTAADWGLDHGYTHMVSLDADGQHNPDDLPGFFAAIIEEPQALFVGCRDFDQQGIPGASRFGRQFSNFWLRLQTGTRIKDSQSGFRAYPLVIFRHLKFLTRRYNFEVEVLVRTAWAGLPLKDLDIAVYYPPADERVSHFRKFMDNWRLTLLNTHLTLRSIVPWPHRKIITAEKSGCAEETVSVLRPLKSLRLLLVHNATPRGLALAASLGVFLGTLPLLFSHTLAILFACSFFGLNKVVAVSSSQLCMPPIVPALCIQVGYFLRHGEWLTEFTLETLGYQALQRLYEWLLGSLVLAPLLALLVGGLTLLLALLIKRQGIAGVATHE